jgi:glycine oxidase
VSDSQARWTIVGQGLAGTSLAWALWKSGQHFARIDRGHGGSSRVAAGMLNPITGKNFEPSWRLNEFLTPAVEFYEEVESWIGRKIWHPYPVLRLAETGKEWEKIRSKLSAPHVAPWVAQEVAPPPGWTGAVLLRGGGRLDTLSFIDGSRDFFTKHGIAHSSHHESSGPGVTTIHCDGSTGLISNRYGSHRCAKGEILTLHAPDWDDTRIRVGAGGWLVPVGHGNFKAGSTYEWNLLDELPTAQGRSKVEAICRKLGGDSFTVLDHQAGIRPILRRSQPLIGPLNDHEWMFNALGSKGSLYAPRMAMLLARWLVDGIEPDPELSFPCYLKSLERESGH